MSEPTAVQSQIRYRKTKAGTWVAYGPASVVRSGQSVTVTKADGSSQTRDVASVGKVFVVDGIEMVYGYLVEVARPAAARTPRPRSSHMCDECGERRGSIEASDMSGIGGLVCGPCSRSGYLSFA